MKTLSVEDLFKRNQSKLELIEFSCEGEYSKEYLPSIRALAQWFNALPLNPSIYDEPGGAFRCAIESCYFVMRQAKSTIFTSDLTSESRRLLEPQYKYAAFLAALASWVDEPFRHFQVLVGAKEFNPVDGLDLSTTLGKEAEYVLRNREVLASSSRRTVAFASALLKEPIKRLSPTVQDALFNSINADRRPSANEIVLQRVVRKGLDQAEDLERRDKKLKHEPLNRDVSSAKFMESSSQDLQPSSDEQEQSPLNTVEPKSEKNVAQSLPGIETIPEISRQLKELLSALAEDIQSGDKKIEETEWITSGLLIPKNFLSGYGKSLQMVLAALQKEKVIVSADTKHVVIDVPFGQLLSPRK